MFSFKNKKKQQKCQESRRVKKSWQRPNKKLPPTLSNPQLERDILWLVQPNAVHTPQQIPIAVVTLIRKVERELLQQAGEDEEELEASERLARTRPLPDTERHHCRIRAQADSMLASFSTPSNKKKYWIKNSEIFFLEKTLFARRFDIRRYHFQERKMTKKTIKCSY